MKPKGLTKKTKTQQQGAKVRIVPLTLLVKINALWSDSFRLFVAGFTWSGGKKKKSKLTV